MRRLVDIHIPPRLRYCLALGVIIRIIIACHIPFQTDPGSHSYIALAQEWIDTGRYASLGTIQRPPAYVTFLFVLKKLSISHHGTILIQHLLGLLSIGLLYWTARLAWSDKSVSLAAGLLFAAHAHQAYRERWIMPETLFVALSCLSLLCVLSLVRSRDKPLGAYAAIGSLCGLTALCRFEFSLFFLFPAWLIWKSSPLKKRLARSGLFSVCAASILLAWTLRNGALFGYFGLSPVGKISMMSHAAPLVPFDKPTYAEAKKAYQTARERDPYSNNSGIANRTVLHLCVDYGYRLQQAWKEVGGMALEGLRAHPARYFAGVLKIFASYWLIDVWDPPIGAGGKALDFWRVADAILGSVAGAVAVFGVCCIVFSRNERASPAAIVVWTAVVLILSVAACDDRINRIRSALEPPLFLLAAFGLSRLRRPALGFKIPR
ncbi:MAG: hypothetical protein ABII00_09455 [Elusimicrobiota bacterium]